MAARNRDTSLSRQSVGTRSVISDVSSVSEISVGPKTKVARPAAPASFEGLDLLQSLAQAESRLQTSCAVSQSDSAESEERDNVHLAKKAEEEIAIRSSSGSSSSGLMHTRGRGDDMQELTTTTATGSLRRRHHPKRGGTNSSSSSSTNPPNPMVASAISAVVKSASCVELDALRSEMAAMAAQHKLDMNVVQDKLETSIAREVQQQMDADLQGKKINKLEAAGVQEDTDKRALEVLLAAARAENETQAKEVHEANDQIAGLVARHARKILNIQDQNIDALAKQGRRNKKDADDNAEEQAESRANNATLKAELANADVKGKKDSDERDKMNYLIRNLKADHKSQVDNLRNMLSHCQNTQEALQELPDDGSKRLKDGKNVTKVDLYEELAQSQEKHREANDALAVMRLEMLSMEQGTIAKTGNSQAEASEPQQASASTGDRAPPSTLQRGGRRGIPRGVGARSAGGGSHGFPMAMSRGMRLPSIQEADSNDGSSQASDSCASGHGRAENDVGDLKDFEDAGAQVKDAGLVQSQKDEFRKTIAELEEQVMAGQQANDLLKEQVADDDARNKNSISRLQKLLGASRDRQSFTAEELAETKKTIASEDGQHKYLMDALQAKLEAAHAEMKVQWDDKKTENVKQDVLVESLQTQVVCALEGKRIAESRVRELQLALAAMDKRYEMEMDHLRTRTLLTEAEKSLTGSASRGQVEQLKDQLQRCREDYNLLLNEVECKEVQWESVLDELRRDHATELMEKQQKCKQDIQDLTSNLSTQNSDLHTEICALKDIFWGFAAAVPGAVGFRCDLEGFKIRDASPAAVAYKAAAEGQCLLSMEGETWKACGLEEAVRQDAHGEEGANHCASKLFDLGPSSVSLGTGGQRKVAVLAARLPPSPARGEGAELVVVLHPHEATSL